MKISEWVKVAIFGVVVSAASFPALAAPSVEELAQHLAAMQVEMDKLKQQIANSATKAEVQLVKKDAATAGEWQQADTLIHMSGYAEVGYTDSASADGSFNVGRFAPIFHFQYRDLVILESELEIEVEDDGQTVTSLEYLTVDWFVNDYMMLVAGKFLSPVGQFRQNLHPSWVNKMTSAPPGFGHDGAAPVSDIGFQLRGAFPIGQVRTNYAVYISNGPELISGFEDGEFELDGVEAEGFNMDGDGEKVVGARLGIFPIAGLEIGLSAANGRATVTSVEDGDNSALGGEDARDYDVIGADFNWQFRKFSIRGEYVETQVGADIGSGNAASDGATWKTWYTQGAYRIGQSKFELVARYTDFNSPHSSQDQKQWAMGTNYLFTNSFIGKINYEFNDGLAGSPAEKDRFQLQLAYGF